MSQFYEYLRSNCCNAKIWNGLFNIDRLNECNRCNKKLVNLDKDSYDIREEE